MTPLWRAFLVAMAALAIVIMFAFIFKAQAASMCISHKSMVDQLLKRYNEVPIARGAANKHGLMVELFKSATGTWTFVGTTGGQLSCVLAAGDGMEIYSQAMLEEKSL